MKKEMKDRAKDLLNELEDLHQQQAISIAELRRSLMILDLWPEAFDGGAVKTYVHGNENTQLLFSIETKSGEKKSFDIRKVNPELWPHRLRQLLKLSQKNNRVRLPPALRFSKEGEASSFPEASNGHE